MDQRDPHCPSLGPHDRPEWVHSPATPHTERRPRGASPQPGAGSRAPMRRVGGRRRSRPFGGGGAEGETPPMGAREPNLFGGQRQVGGSAGAALPRKCNTGAQRSAQAVQNAAVECKGKSWPDETLQGTGSRRESAA